MKIAVVGCGAVGSYYGAKLSHAGDEVHFLLRSDYEQVRRKGVQILSPQGDFRVQPKCARTPENIGPCDLVLVALKTTGNDQFASLLPPLLNSHTAVVTLQNGLGNEERLAEIASVQQILGGLCFVCLNRIEPGVVRHIDHGLAGAGGVSLWPGAANSTIWPAGSAAPAFPAKSRIISRARIGRNLCGTSRSMASAWPARRD